MLAIFPACPCSSVPMLSNFMPEMFWPVMKRKSVLRAPVQLYCSADQSWALNLFLQDCLHFPTLHCAHILSPKYTNQRLNVSPPISCALMTLWLIETTVQELSSFRNMRWSLFRFDRLWSRSHELGWEDKTSCLY